jgi:putative DNA primase/helicase
MMLDQFFAKALVANGLPIPSSDFRGAEFMRWGKNQRYWAKKIDGGPATANGYAFGDFATDFSKRIFTGEVGKPQKCRPVCVSHGFCRNAEEIYSDAAKLTKHPYLDRKQIKTQPGLKCWNCKIVVPIYNDKALISLQFIDSFGNKKYLKGSAKGGGYFTIGNTDSSEIILIAEGLATGCSVFESTGFPTIVAFDAGNLGLVAEKIRAKYAAAKIVICADNDAYSEKNIGILRATAAACKNNCAVAVPEFVDKTGNPTDFNDLMILAGEERVKEIILESIDKTQQCKNEIPENFELTDEGLCYIDYGQNARKHRISNYIKVVAMATDENGIWGRMVEVKNIRGESKQIFVPDHKFSGNCEQLRRELASLGLCLESAWKAKDLLSKYLTICIPKKHVICISKPGWRFGKIFVASDKIIGKTDKEIICAGSDLSTYKRKGSIENWKENVAAYCPNNSRLMLSVCAAFAAPVMDICGFAGGGFHFTGRSSVGKTTCLRVAASVCGDKNYIKSWRTTDNGLESVAAQYNDSLLILDEMSQVNPNKVGDIAYMLANGCGKTRANSQGGAQSTKTWRVLFLSRFIPLFYMPIEWAKNTSIHSSPLVQF